VDSVHIARVDASAFAVPTDAPESDGTYEWSKTTLVTAEVTAGGRTGLGYTYADAAARQFIAEHLAKAVEGLDAFDIPAASSAMYHAVRNVGRHGVAAMAISAVDTALWDLKARLLDMPLAKLLGEARRVVPVYGSGGFTSYSEDGLAEQLGGWVEDGISQVKMKVGRDPGMDDDRVRAARRAIGPDAQLFVDANGAYDRKQALAMAEAFAAHGVSWFEEPVSSDDLEGLSLIRERAPAGMDVAAGEYGYDSFYFRRMLEAGAVDVLQADATRCGGYTGFLRAAALCEARSLPLSAHTAPALHLPVCASCADVRHIEYFHDHARVEALLFEGAPRVTNGALAPDLSRPGHGLSLKRGDAERYRAA
jgi:L-alanine-DL-glutamate epimerase-like enolase superfamily enzyme